MGDVTLLNRSIRKKAELSRDHKPTKVPMKRPEDVKLFNISIPKPDNYLRIRHFKFVGIDRERNPVVCENDPHIIEAYDSQFDDTPNPPPKRCHIILRLSYSENSSKAVDRFSYGEIACTWFRESGTGQRQASLRIDLERSFRINVSEIIAKLGPPKDFAGLLKKAMLLTVDIFPAPRQGLMGGLDDLPFAYNVQNNSFSCFLHLHARCWIPPMSDWKRAPFMAPFTLSPAGSDPDMTNTLASTCALQISVQWGTRGPSKLDQKVSLPIKDRSSQSEIEYTFASASRTYSIKTRTLTCPICSKWIGSFEDHLTAEHDELDFTLAIVHPENQTKVFLRRRQKDAVLATTPAMCLNDNGIWEPRPSAGTLKEPVSESSNGHLKPVARQSTSPSAGGMQNRELSQALPIFNSENGRSTPCRWATKPIANDKNIETMDTKTSDDERWTEVFTAIPRTKDLIAVVQKARPPFWDRNGTQRNKEIKPLSMNMEDLTTSSNTQLHQRLQTVAPAKPLFSNVRSGIVNELKQRSLHEAAPAVKKFKSSNATNKTNSSGSFPAAFLAQAQSNSIRPGRISTKPLTKPKFAVPRPLAPGITLFRSIAKTPVEVGELLSESDDEVDEAWLRRTQDNNIDDLPGVSPEEKRFFKRWNKHWHDDVTIGDRDFPNVWERFVKSNLAFFKDKAMEKELIKRFAQANLDGLLDVDTIDDAFEWIDAYTGPAEPKPEPQLSTCVGTCTCGELALPWVKGHAFCEGQDCMQRDYHMKCVGIDTLPDKWYCPACEQQPSTKDKGKGRAIE